MAVRAGTLPPAPCGRNRPSCLPIHVSLPHAPTWPGWLGRCGCCTADKVWWHDDEWILVTRICNLGRGLVAGDEGRVGRGASHGSGPGNHIPWIPTSTVHHPSHGRSPGDGMSFLALLPRLGGGCLVSLLAGIAGGVAKVGGCLLPLTADLPGSDVSRGIALAMHCFPSTASGDAAVGGTRPRRRGRQTRPTHRMWRWRRRRRVLVLTSVRYRNQGPIMDGHDPASYRHMCNIGGCGLSKAPAWIRSNERLPGPELKLFVLSKGTASPVVRGRREAF